MTQLNDPSANPQHSSEAGVVDLHPDRDTFLDEVLRGLSRKNKTLPCKYMYDARGADLFERICELDEYYPTRTELAIMNDHAADMASAIGPRAVVIEPGSGAGLKTRLLLDALQDPVAYMPIDIARDQLDREAALFNTAYPAVEVLPVCADFTADFDLPEPARPANRRLVYIPGSTIGNFTTPERHALLRRWSDGVGPNGALLLGIDLVKGRDELEAAYDDAEGVTEAFNTNIFHRMNRELDADVDVDAFDYKAAWNQDESRVEMKQVSTKDQSLTIAGHTISLAEGEEILTECSHKFTIPRITEDLSGAALTLTHTWTDPDDKFAIVFATRNPTT